MEIGIPKEIKTNENRVGITPAGVIQLTGAGHHVVVEHDAGLVAGYTDADYQEAGATIADAKTAWQQAMVIKVKEPLESEYHYFRPGLILYTYLHLAANKPLTEALLASQVTAIGYETMTERDGSLPALAPMSQVAGRMAVLLGAQFLQTQYGGKGVLLPSVPGVKKANVVIIGGGSVGQNAAQVALGLGARVTVLDVNSRTLANIDANFDGQVETVFSNPHTVAAAVKNADLVIGAVLIPGHKAPTLVTEAMIKSMEPGSVVVDIPIDQGGIFETSSHATGFDAPTYTVHDVIHYAVANIPGAVPQTATDALTSVTIPAATKIASLGLKQAAEDGFIASGINTIAGALVEAAVADSLKLPVTALSERL